MGILDGLGDMTGGITSGLKLYNLPLVGGMFDNPNEQAKQQAFLQASKMYQDYRPEQAQARMNALNMQLGAYSDARRALQQNWGSGYGAAPQVGMPMSPRMMQIGTINQTPQSDASYMGGLLGKTGSGALAGAGAGAMIGALGGPVGMAGGAAIGAGVGLLSGMAQGKGQDTTYANYGAYAPYKPKLGG